jgi:hypothetical protein
MSDVTRYKANPKEGAYTPSEDAVRWWDETDPELRAKAVRATLDGIDDENSSLQEAHLRHMRLYRNLAMVGFGPYGTSRADIALGAPLSLNVIRNMVNAVHAKMTKNRPRMTFQTSGGNFEQREKARLLQQFMDGLFYKGRVYKETNKAFLDAAIFGTGFVKVIPGKKKNSPIVYERVFAPEIRIDPVEGMHGKPRNWYQVKYIDRKTLMRKYPDKKDQIAEFKSISHGDDVATWGFIPDRSSKDVFRVVEAYHLATEKGAKDGTVSIVCEEVELASGPWDYEFSPFVSMRWGPGPLGFWGMGLPEELMGIQVEINRIVRKIQMAFALLSNPYIFIDRASNVQRSHVTDIPGSVILYNNKPPAVHAPQVVHQEVFQQLERLYRWSYEIAGVSMNQATGGGKSYESGRAQLVDNQTGDIRFANVAREWEGFHEQIAYVSLRYVEAENTDISVKAFGEEGYEEINFAEHIDLEEDEWVMRIRPTSALGEEVAGQIDQAERLIKSGLIQHPEEILEQMEAPDIAAYVKRVTAAKRLTEKMITQMLKGGAQMMPEPHMNLALSLDICQSMYLEAKLDGVVDDRLKKLRTFMKSCVRMMQQAAPPPAMTGGPAPSAQPPAASSAPMPEGMSA